jgi:hypothetical protein
MAEQLDRIEHKVDCLNRKLDALLAVEANDTEALREMVATAPAVVPNEDEAMPVLTNEQYAAMSWPNRLDRLAEAKCPQCERRAYSAAAVEEQFGYRTMYDGTVRVQSWCRECRKTAPTKAPLVPVWIAMNDAQPGEELWVKHTWKRAEDETETEPNNK